MARIIAGMGTSHVPGVGAAMDNGKTHEEYWVDLFKGFEPLRAWHAENVPDVNIIVFNDHATSMALPSLRWTRSRPPRPMSTRSSAR